MKKQITAPFVLIFSLLIFFIANSCKKPKDETPALETGTMTDVDNHIYKTVKIGNQWWMAEDLRVTKYRNGYSIQQVTSDSAQWKTDTVGVYCDLKINQNTVGEFYNWYAIHNANNLAPAGWHIPSDDEWKELEQYLGMSATEANNGGWRGTHEGEKLKTVGNTNWTKSEPIWGTNESGFSALPYGCRLFDFSSAEPEIGATGFWWSSTTHADDGAWYRYLDYKNANVFRSHCSKNYGFSVRCVKD